MSNYNYEELFNLIYITGKRENKYMKNKYIRAFKMLPKSSLELLGKILERKDIRFYSARQSYVIGDEVRCADKAKKYRPCVYIAYDADSQTIFHELGHAVEGIPLGKNLTTNYLHGDMIKTFSQIACDELEKNHQTIYDQIMKEYHEVVVKKLGEEKYKKIIEYLPLHIELDELNDKLPPVYHVYNVAGMDYDGDFKVALKKWFDKESKSDYTLKSQGFDLLLKMYKHRDYIMKVLEKSGYVEDFIDAHLLDGAHQFNVRNYPLIDAVGVYHDLSLLGFVYHTKSYYQYKSKISGEIFANLFAAKMLDETLTLDTFEEYMPETYKAFNELWSVINDYYLLNKPVDKDKLVENIIVNGMEEEDVECTLENMNMLK